MRDSHGVCTVSAMMLFILSLASAQEAEPEPETPAEEASEVVATPEEEPEATSEEEPEAPAPAEAKVYTLPSIEGELPSALTTRDEVPESEGSIDDFLRSTGIELEDFERPALVRGSWFFRPHTGVAQLVGDAEGGAPAFRFGFSAGRRYATVQALPVQVMSEIGVKATLPVGGAVGRRVEAFAGIGPWLGPVRVQLGLHVRSEREQWRQRSLDLQDALLIGGDLQVALDLQYVNVSVGILPMSIVAGDRPSAREGDPVLPVIASETVYSAGVGIQPGLVGVRVHGSWRDTSIGGLLEVGALVAIQLGRPK